MSSDIFLKKPKVFLDGIYANPLGEIRFENLSQDLNEFLMKEQIDYIVDIGAGSAPVTLGLMHGHPNIKATLVEPSRQLLEEARENAKKLQIDGKRIELMESSFEGYLGSGHFMNLDGKRMLIICHAVANWTDNPMEFIRKLLQMSGENAFVSLVIGASIGKALRFAHQGNLDDMIAAVRNPGSAVGSLLEAEKVRPLNPIAVEREIEKTHKIISKAAVRVFADYIKPEILKNAEKLKKVKEAEDAARKKDEFWMLGQLVHFIISKADNNI